MACWSSRARRRSRRRLAPLEDDRGAAEGHGRLNSLSCHPCERRLTLRSVVHADAGEVAGFVQAQDEQAAAGRVGEGRQRRSHRRREAAGRPLDLHLGKIAAFGAQVRYDVRKLGYIHKQTYNESLSV